MKKNSIVSVCIIIAAILVGMFLLRIKTTVVETSGDYKNATYTIDGRNVTLVNGHAEEEVAPGSALKIVTQYFGNEARGDLNGDGKEDVAFLVTQQSGGSGTFYYVVVATRSGDSYVGTNAIFLGDRIAPQTTEIKGTDLVVNYAERKADEPMSTRPSIGVSRYLSVIGTELIAQD